MKIVQQVQASRTTYHVTDDKHFYGDNYVVAFVVRYRRFRWLQDFLTFRRIHPVIVAAYRHIAGDVPLTRPLRLPMTFQYFTITAPWEGSYVVSVSIQRGDLGLITGSLSVINLSGSTQTIRLPSVAHWGVKGLLTKTRDLIREVVVEMEKS